MNQPLTSRIPKRIVFHLIIFIFLFFLPFLLFRANFPGPVLSGSLILFWVSMGMVLIPLYFSNVYFFVPVFLVKGKYWSYAIAIVLISVAGITVHQMIIQLLDSYGFTVNLFPPELLNDERFRSMPQLPKTPDLPPFSIIIYLAIGTCFELIINREDQKKDRERIEKEKVMTELSFLKSQINPHFLFNTLNNIYSLAEKRSSKTGESILILSNMMRYMLYESNHPKIQLNKEIEYLKNYIAIQRLRISSDHVVTISFSTEGDMDGIMIEPLIFIGFIENAFKHGISSKQSSIVEINLQVQGGTLQLTVYNTKRSASSLMPNENGIGLVNARRRLEILYKDAHSMTIEDKPDYFEIRLTIRLASKTKETSVGLANAGIG